MRYTQERADLSSPCMLNSDALAFAVDAHTQVPSVTFICSACAKRSTHSVITSAIEQHSSIQILNPDEKIVENYNFEEQGTHQVDIENVAKKETGNVQSATSDQINSSFNVSDVFSRTSERLGNKDFWEPQNQKSLRKDFPEPNVNVNLVSESVSNDVTFGCLQCKTREIDEERISPDQVFEPNSTAACAIREDYQITPNFSTAEKHIVAEKSLTIIKTESESKSKSEKQFIGEFKASNRLEKLEQRIQNQGKRIFGSLYNSPVKKQTLFSNNTHHLVSSRAEKERSLVRFGSCIDFNSSLDVIFPFSSLLSPSSLTASCPASIHIEEDSYCRVQQKYEDNEIAQDIKSLNKETFENNLKNRKEAFPQIGLVEETGDNVQVSHTYCKDNNSNFLINKTEGSKDNSDISVFQLKTTNSPESTTDSEISKIFYEHNEQILTGDNCEYELNIHKSYKENDKVLKAEEYKETFSTCEFNVNCLPNLPAEYSESLVFECYDELIEELEIVDNSSKENKGLSSEEFKQTPVDGDDSCYCSIEAVPLYHSLKTAMRETNGTLRGLLKKPNRPPTSRKNRVVFDETRNQFFEADYIILIREDCPYDEEDEEPCTCGEHELVRICCDDSCNCTYTDGRTPPVSRTKTMKLFKLLSI